MSNLFITILNMSVTASFVAAFVIIARQLLKKAPKIFSYALWAVVLFRMLCPFSFESIVSIIPVNSEPIPQDIVTQKIPRIDSGVNFVDNAVNSTTITEPPMFETAEDKILRESGEAGTGLIQDIIYISSYVWLAGIIALFGYAVISYIKIKRGIYAATLVRDNIFETDRIKTPFVIGFIKPRVYLPAGINETEADYIIRHEHTHIKRGDHIIKLIAFIGLTVHWFNPLMWASYFLMTKDMELSCDESVMKRSSEDIRTSYSNLLLSLSVKQSGLPNPLAFGESNVKSRIKNVLQYKKPAFWISVVSVILVLSVTVALAGNQINNVEKTIPARTDSDGEIIKPNSSDTQDGVTVSIESVHGGNDTVFIKLKIETDDIILDDNFDYTFLTKIDFKSNPDDLDKNLINGGGSSVPVDKELWTEHIRYIEIKMSVQYESGANFSLGDGQERVMVLEFFGYINEKYEQVMLAESEWRLAFSYNTGDSDINVIFAPFMFYGKSMMGNNRLAQMTSIKLNQFGMVCRYTAFEIQEALDFTADVILKDRTRITLIKKSSGCGINLEGFMIFNTPSTLDLDEVAYIQIGDEIIAVDLNADFAPAPAPVSAVMQADNAINDFDPGNLPVSFDEYLYNIPHIVSNIGFPVAFPH